MLDAWIVTSHSWIHESQFRVLVFVRLATLSKVGPLCLQARYSSCYSFSSNCNLVPVVLVESLAELSVEQQNQLHLWSFPIALQPFCSVCSLYMVRTRRASQHCNNHNLALTKHQCGHVTFLLRVELRSSIGLVLPTTWLACTRVLWIWTAMPNCYGQSCGGIVFPVNNACIEEKMQLLIDAPVEEHNGATVLGQSADLSMR